MTTHISAREAAELLGISKNTLIRLIHSNQITAHKKTSATNSPFVVDKESVLAYIERHR